MAAPPPTPAEPGSGSGSTGSVRVPAPTPTPLPSRSVLISRAVGCVLASAAGDALGAPYEMKHDLVVSLPPPPSSVPFISSRHWAQGEWTDDTAMAIPLLEAAAYGSDLRTSPGLSRVARRWLQWASNGIGGGGGKGIGRLTSLLLSRTRNVLNGPDVSPELLQKHNLAAVCRTQARAVHEEKCQSAGNGALMRVGPLALGYLTDPDGLAAAARLQAQLTHWEDDAGDAAVLWALGVRGAILAGRTDVRAGLAFIPAERRQLWTTRIDEAERHSPAYFASSNTSIGAALQAAWAACRQGGKGGVKAVLEAAVRGGGDTDTVAAIAGAMAGAVFGAESVPTQYKEALHGWPGISSRELAEMATRAVERYVPA